MEQSHPGSCHRSRLSTSSTPGAEGSRALAGLAHYGHDDQGHCHSLAIQPRTFLTTIAGCGESHMGRGVALNSGGLRDSSGPVLGWTVLLRIQVSEPAPPKASVCGQRASNEVTEVD